MFEDYKETFSQIKGNTNNRIHCHFVNGKYYLISEYDIEEYRSPGYIYSKYNITKDYTVDFSKIHKLKFKDGRTKKH